MKKYYVYIHVCPNEKRYVGCTVKIKPEYRWGRNGNSYQYNKCFYSDILKYGWDNIAHEIFEVGSKEEMYRKEIELISFYHTNDPRHGYNHSVGGERGALGCTRSEEFRKRVSEAVKERNSDPEFRKKQSEAQKKVHADPEYRRKLSRPHKPFSEEAKGRMAEASRKRWSDPEFRKKQSEARKGKPKPRVKIQLPDGTILEITKNNLARDYVNKGRKFEYVS